MNRIAKNGAAFLLYFVFVGSAFAGGAATRSFSPTAYTPGSTVTVKISIVPDTTSYIYGVEELPPAGWTITNVSDGGTVFNNSLSSVTVKWGLFVGNGIFDNTSTPSMTPVARTLTYTARAPSTETGVKAIRTSTACFDGSNFPVGGTATIGKAPVHPADTTANFAIDVTEYSSALFCWQNHCPTIPTTYFSNLIYLKTKNNG